MKSRQEIFDILSSHLAQIQREYGVEKIGVSGSVIKDQHTLASDVDILVEFSDSIGMVKFLKLRKQS